MGGNGGKLCTLGQGTWNRGEGCMETDPELLKKCCAVQVNSTMYGLQLSYIQQGPLYDTSCLVIASAPDLDQQ